ncbi:hypothetical protein QAD02_018697 [Eretmocerus hayati]|uniref:Uncharacterized protein n=1 Tax=Eretmocerus hayati TaxID=131215 RepID=A0ACC2PMA2_9HYME|nr:hypothetical protein QAD02_018697 [Eretmocerus hayati]
MAPEEMKAPVEKVVPPTEAPNNVVPEGIQERQVDVKLWEPKTKFPPNYPFLLSVVCGHTIKSLSWKSLDHDELVDDVIVNSYLKLICSQAKRNLGVNILPFDIHLVQDIILRKSLGGFSSWVRRTNLMEFKIWLLPIVLNDHWTMLLVIPSKKLMIYLDSLHGYPARTYIESTCAFIRTCCNTDKKINFTKWTLLVARDIPKQYRPIGDSSVLTMNCCPHILTWAYIVCTGEYRIFNDQNMDSIRCAIAGALLKHNGFKDMTVSKGDEWKKSLRNSSTEKIVLTVRKVKINETTEYPIFTYANTFELCSNLYKL